MTDQQHPITPPPELIEDWIEIAKPLPHLPPNPGEFATLAARWGADQELEACCEWLEKGPYGFSITASAPHMISDLRAARRPKPPRLAEEALDAQERMWIGGTTDADWELIRSALKRLQELEGAND